MHNNSMEKAKLKYKELKKQLKADPNNEKLQKKFLKKKEKYKMLKKQLKKDEGESSKLCFDQLAYSLFN